MLEALRKQSWVVVPRNFLMSVEEERLLARLIHYHWRPLAVRERVMRPAVPRNGRLVSRPFWAVGRRLLQRLRAALPRERFELGSVYIGAHHSTGGRPIHTPHVDFAYLVLSYAFGYKGTRLFTIGRKVSASHVPHRHGVIMSGETRQNAVGVRAAIHSVPVRCERNRAILLFSFRRIPRGISIRKKVSRSVNARVARARYHAA